VVIDGFWFVNDVDTSEAEKEPGLFERHYTKQTREELPAMGWVLVQPVADLFARAGFSDIRVSDLTDVHRLAENPPSAQPWYVVMAHRDR